MHSTSFTQYQLDSRTSSAVVHVDPPPSFLDPCRNPAADCDKNGHALPAPHSSVPPAYEASITAKSRTRAQGDEAFDSNSNYTVVEYMSV